MEIAAYKYLVILFPASYLKTVLEAMDVEPSEKRRDAGTNSFSVQETISSQSTLTLEYMERMNLALL